MAKSNTTLYLLVGIVILLVGVLYFMPVREAVIIINKPCNPKKKPPQSKADCPANCAYDGNLRACKSVNTQRQYM